MKSMYQTSLNAKQQGNTLIIAIIVITVLLFVGLSLQRIIQGAAHNDAVEYLGARAYLAAQTGLQGALTELFPLNNSAQTCASLRSNWSFSGQYLQGCRVVISCQERLNIPEPNVTDGDINVFHIESSATCPVNNCALGESCRSEFWQTQRTLNVEAKTLR